MEGFSFSFWSLSFKSWSTKTREDITLRHNGMYMESVFGKKNEGNDSVKVVSKHF